MSEDLQATIEALTKRIAQLEAQAELREIPEDHIVAIAAAVAGYMGCKAKIRQVRLNSGRAWADAARRDLHSTLR